MSKEISIPEQDSLNYWHGTTGVKCSCGGSIEWAEAGYVPGARACRSCLALYAVRGRGDNRKLIPQHAGNDGIVRDAEPGESCYRVPQDLYPNWYQAKVAKAQEPSNG